MHAESISDGTRIQNNNGYHPLSSFTPFIKANEKKNCNQFAWYFYAYLFPFMFFDDLTGMWSIGFIDISEILREEYSLLISFKNNFFVCIW